MTFFSHFSLPVRRFGPVRHKPAHVAAPRRGTHTATLSRDELLREVIAIIG